MKKKSTITKNQKSISDKDLINQARYDYIQKQLNDIKEHLKNSPTNTPIILNKNEIEKLKDSAAKYVTDNLGNMDKLIIKDNLITNMFAKMFEPKSTSRFVVEVMDAAGNLIIPHYLVKEVKNVSFYYNWLGQLKMSPLEVTIYDPIVPASLPTIFNTRNKYEILLRLVGPVGDVLETTYITGAKIKNITRTNLKWAPYNKDIDTEVCLNVTFKVGKFSLGELI